MAGVVMKYVQKIPNIHSDYLNQLLRIKYGIKDVEKFLHPIKEYELDSEKLNNCAETVKFIYENLDKRFGLIVDSDMDGYCSSAIIYNYLKRINPMIDITYYLHSGKQHGLEDMIDIIDTSLDIIILPDAGSNDDEFCERLGKEYNIKTCILDHHHSDTPASQFSLRVNNQLSPEYQNKTLSGAGVVYKFCQLFDRYYNYNYADEFLDLTAMAIIGDMMDLNELETRYIVEQGLANVKNLFLIYLIEKQSYSLGEGPLTPTKISFYIVPLVNALIRVGTEQEKEIMFEAFINGEKMVPSTKRGAKGKEESVCEQAVRNCVNARNRQNRAKEKASDTIDMIICKEGLDENKILTIVIEDNTIDTTLTGLLAMQTAQKYKRPTLIMREVSDGGNRFYRGSGRGLDKTAVKDFRQFLIDSNLIEWAEGHPNSFGISIPVSNLTKLNDYANIQLANVEFNENIYEVDFIEDASTSFNSLINEIGRAEKVWGKSVEEPYIVIEGITLRADQFQFMGTNKDTVKWQLNGVSFIKFKDLDFIETLQNLRADESITVLGRANINRYMGNEMPQFFVLDYNVNKSIFDF